jgi:hypothetical protein
VAGIDPQIEEYTGDDPLGFVISHNLHRRHDSENERAMVGARMANLKNGQRASSMETGGNPVISIERAAELSGSSPSNIKRAKPIVQSIIQHPQAGRGGAGWKFGFLVASRFLR